MFIIIGYDREANACSPWTSCFLFKMMRQNDDQQGKDVMMYCHMIDI